LEKILKISMEFKFPKNWYPDFSLYKLEKLKEYSNQAFLVLTRRYYIGKLGYFWNPVNF